MRRGLAALLLAIWASCAVPILCPAVEETQYFRRLPTAYVPGKPITVSLCFDALWHWSLDADFYEVVPAGWNVIRSWPPFTSFDEESGTIFWRVRTGPPYWEIGLYGLRYEVLVPVSETKEVAFAGNAAYCFDSGDPDCPGFVATTGDMSLSRGPQEVRRVPRDHPTIQGAIDASLYGDTVVIGPGVYVENIEMQQGVDLKGVGWPPPEIRATSDLWQDAVITIAPHCCIHGLIISSGYYGVRGLYGPFEVRSCVITGNTYRGVDVDVITFYGANRVVNCTIVDNSGTGAYLGGASAGNLVINSIAYGNGGRDIWGGVTRFSCLQDEICDGVGENNIYADPMFVNAPGGRLRASAELAVH